MVKTFIITEMIFSILFLLLPIYFIELYGLIGVLYAFALSYTIYLPYYLLHEKLFFKALKWKY